MRHAALLALPLASCPPFEMGYRCDLEVDIFSLSHTGPLLVPGVPEQASPPDLRVTVTRRADGATYGPPSPMTSAPMRRTQDEAGFELHGVLLWAFVCELPRPGRQARLRHPYNATYTFELLPGDDWPSGTPGWPPIDYDYHASREWHEVPICLWNDWRRLAPALSASWTSPSITPKPPSRPRCSRSAWPTPVP